MKGYRTVALNIAMTLAMGGSVQAADLPPAWRAWLTLGIAVWGFVGILLRIATSTPIGQKAADALGARIGITHDEMQDLIDQLPKAEDFDHLKDRVTDIAVDVRAVQASIPPAATAIITAVPPSADASRETAKGTSTS